MGFYHSSSGIPLLIATHDPYSECLTKYIAIVQGLILRTCFLATDSPSLFLDALPKG